MELPVVRNYVMLLLNLFKGGQRDFGKNRVMEREFSPWRWGMTYCPSSGTFPLILQCCTLNSNILISNYPFYLRVILLLKNCYIAGALPLLGEQSIMMSISVCLSLRILNATRSVFATFVRSARRSSGYEVALWCYLLMLTSRNGHAEDAYSKWHAKGQQGFDTVAYNSTAVSRYDTIRDAILTCTRNPT